MTICAGFRRFSFISISLVSFLPGSLVLAQSTGAIQGTITDASGAAVPSASVTVQQIGTGEERKMPTDPAGLFFVPSLPAGTYRMEIAAPGMASTVINNLVVPVAGTVTQNVALSVASTSQTVEVQASAVSLDPTKVANSTVVNQATVQEVPLNGRHFVDLALLVPLTVTPPANGFLTAPLRGQGSFAFNAAGGREDSINFMINGINLSDPLQNQITFQPTINTVDEFSIDNSTFSAEYGRNSGSIVNIATRRGANTWHGEAYEYLRNNDLDARNFTNPANTTVNGVLNPAPQFQFIRNQFGGAGGGAIRKDRDFIFLSYEGLRQRQAVSSPSTTLSLAQVAQAQATSDAAIRALLPLIPAPNSGTNQFSGAGPAPVNIEQGTLNYTRVFSNTNQFNAYYAIQRDQRNEPSATDNNTFPNEGDMRNGRRQLLTLNDSWVISPTLVNEARLGGNRIHLVFQPDNSDNPLAFNINDGVTAAIGLPQITVSGAFIFGGDVNLPQGRGDNTVVFSDTLNWIHGKHTVKFGGEFRRANTDNFSYTPGTFSFSSVANFLADNASGFTANPYNKSNRTYSNSIGAFITDSWKVLPAFTVQLGLRYDWYGTPTEAANRFVVFDPATDTLQHVGMGGTGPSLAYNQSARNFEPRVGLAWSPFGPNGKTLLRSGFAIMTDQPTLNLVTGLASNPPYAFPVSTTAAGITLQNAITLAGGAVSPFSVAHNYRAAYVSQWNLSVQQQFSGDMLLTAGYYGSKGTGLNIERNYNQFIEGVRPYPALAANSPIDPGMALTNILVYESDGNSSYNALAVTGTRRFARGFNVNASYTWSKSIDDNSRSVEGISVTGGVQDSNNIRGDRGLSDFDTRNRFVVSGVYELPFHGNRIKEGWEVSLIEQSQSGNPINFHTATTTFTGIGSLRPSVTGQVVTGIAPASNGSPTNVTFVQNPSVFVNQGNAFGNLGRNVIIGPGFSNFDFSLAKNTRIVGDRVTLQFRVDAFDLLNQVNFMQPASTLNVAAGASGGAQSTFGLITAGTRFPTGDAGSSRQLQLSMKLRF